LEQETQKSLLLFIKQVIQVVGANAQTHANLQSRGFSASWHWQVDDKEAIQSFDHTWRLFHAGDGRGKGNMESIGIESCINSDGDYVQAVKNTAKLVAKIMKDEGIPYFKSRPAQLLVRQELSCTN